MNITPNKRKRESLGGPLGTADKENYAYNSGFMEIKSLADLKSASLNPFEVARKPPKKKKKCDFDAEENCFVNPALNLNGPEHVVNPFEIRRPAQITREPVVRHCFVNPGLNIRGPEKEVRNPFEIMRQNTQDQAPVSGLENGGFNNRSPMISRAIAIPFTPTIGCRINFNDVPLESLTPCSMLAKKLVFSPEVPNMYDDQTPRKSTVQNKVDEVELSVISEESLDIIAELDCYQLELENSINEAKMNKKKRRSSGGRGKNLMDLKNRKSFAMRINQTEDVTHSPKEGSTDPSLVNQLTPKLETSSDPIEEPAVKDSSGVHYEEVEEEPQSEDEFEFKNPAPFVRTFKRKSIRKPTANTQASQESLPEIEATKSKSIGNSIRNSFRRLIKPNSKKSASSEQLNVNVCEPETQSMHSNLFSTIRQSLRRKPVAKVDPLSEADSKPHELSIVVDSERKVFRQKPKSGDAQASSNEDLGAFGRKTTLRSSFRNTSKDVRRQMLKSMFKKNVEEYEFKK